MAKANKKTPAATPDKPVTPEPGTTNTTSPKEPAVAGLESTPAPDGGAALTPGHPKGPEAGAIKPLALSDKIDWLLTQVPAGDDQSIFHVRRLLSEAKAWALKGEKTGAIRA